MQSGDLGTPHATGPATATRHSCCTRRPLLGAPATDPPCSPRYSQDTAGQERFDSLSSFYCRGARAAIICFDLTDRASFEALQTKWIKKVLEEAEQGCHICLVGTKLDLVQSGMATRAIGKEVRASVNI